MRIDEEGLYKVKGTAESDHNSITIDINIGPDSTVDNEKKVNWRINAPQTKWEQFRQEIGAIQFSWIQDQRLNMTDIYGIWLKQIEAAAYRSIGKTTHKNKRKEEVSEAVVNLQKQRREIKDKYEKELQTDKKSELKQLYIQKQNEVRQQMELDRKIDLEERIKTIISSGNQNLFWKEKARICRNDKDKWLITKDETGKHLFDPIQNQNNMADYYEKLYAKPETEYHSYHEHVVKCMEGYLKIREYDHLEYNQPPSITDIDKIIKNKKNGKST